VTVARHAVRLLAFVLLLAPAAGAEVTVRATVDPAQVRVGESATFAVEVDGAQIAPVPDWLVANRDALSGKVSRIPTREEMQPMVNEQLIVELYSR